jgi:hypothetical protein
MARRIADRTRSKTANIFASHWWLRDGLKKTTIDLSVDGQVWEEVSITSSDEESQEPFYLPKPTVNRTLLSNIDEEKTIEEVVVDEETTQEGSLSDSMSI